MSTLVRPRLLRGDLLPELRTPVPGPRALACSRRAADVEPPGINTLYGGEPNIWWQEARGSNVLDVDGNRYVDLTSGFGVCAVGHRHPQVVAAIAEQSERLLHSLGDAIGHPLRLELAEQLRRLSPWPDAQTYFAVSGADAVEIAIKTALLHQQRRGRNGSRILVFEPSYHGLTAGALTLGSRAEFRLPFLAHLHDHLARLPFGTGTAAIDQLLDERSDVVAAIVEPIVGREGVLLPPQGWLAHLGDACRRHDVLLICDEIFTGFGRTGRCFAFEHEGVVPDLLCCGKALGGGLPIGAVLGSRDLMSAWATPGEALHTATFVAHPLACAAALATLRVLASENLMARAAQAGEQLAPRLEEWPARFARTVEAVRGRGLLWGVELRARRLGGELVEMARSRGILLLAGGPQGRVAQLVPALDITEQQLSCAVDLLEDALGELETGPWD